MVDAVLIGTVIQKPRRSGGMSQEVLSGLAGPDRTHHSRIGRGLPSPATDTLFKISHAPDMASHEIISAVEKAQETKEQDKKKRETARSDRLSCRNHAVFRRSEHGV